MKFSKHSHIPFLILAFLITLFVAAVYMYMYRFAESAIAKSKDAKQSVATEELNRAAADAYMKDFKETREDWARLPEYFVDSKDVVAFIERIEKIGSDTGAEVSLSSIDADQIAGSATGTVGAIRARVVASGQWSSVMKTLKLLELLPYNAKIGDVKLFYSVKESGKEKKAGWNLTLEVHAPLINSPTK